MRALNTNPIKRNLLKFLQDYVKAYQNLANHFVVCISRLNENMEFPGLSGEDIEWLQVSIIQQKS